MAASSRHGTGSEYEHQKTVVKFLRTAMPSILFCASAGGMHAGSKAEGARMKASGYSAGFPDLFVYESRGEFSGLAIELKRDRKSKASPKQKEWIKKLKDRGYSAHVCHGADEAIKTIKEYLKGLSST